MKNIRLLTRVFLLALCGCLALTQSIQAQEAAPAANKGAKVIGSFYPGKFTPVSHVGAALAAGTETKTSGQGSKDEAATQVRQTTTVAAVSSGVNAEATAEGVTQNGVKVAVRSTDNGGRSLFELREGKWVDILNPKTGLATTSKGDVLRFDANSNGGVSLLERRNYQATYYPNGQVKTESFDWAEMTDNLAAQSKTISAAYDKTKGTITYKDAAGKTHTVNLADIGLSAEWMSALLKKGGELSVELNDDGSLKLLAGKEKGTDGKEGAKKWEFDPSARLVAHYTGEAGKEKISMVTSDQKYTNYIWGSPDAKDPGEGPDGHLVVQRFNYDKSGNLQTVEYFTWTAGDRQGQDKARYMYRQDTYKTGDSKTACPDEQSFTTKYYNDPFPVDWDPVLTGVVSKDKYGNYWLTTKDGKNYLLTARVDGFDADKDGTSGADEMNALKWESLLGKEITVRGHQVNEDSEGGIYMDGKKADLFEVCDIIIKEGCSKFDSLLKNLEDVAKAVDPINSGLVGNNTRGTLGFVNLFNGRLPDTSELEWSQHLPRLMSGYAPFYIDSIPQNIRAFATPELETALRALEDARNDAQASTDEENNDAQEGANAQLSTENQESTVAVDKLLEKSKEELDQI